MKHIFRCAGHGLEWLWPFLLGYPQDKIAVIKEICVVKPETVLQLDSKMSTQEAQDAAAEKRAVVDQFRYDSTVGQLA